MKINVGSKNQIKLQAVHDAIALYPKLFLDATIIGMEASAPFGHPKNLEENLNGSMERAKKVFTDCDYSIGLESGLMEVPFTKTGFMEVGTCAIYDGERFYLGLSPAFEWPQKVTDLILSGEADASQAFKQLGLTHHEKIGAIAGGLGGFLTEGRLTRETFTKESIIMALIQLEKPELYT